LGINSTKSRGSRAGDMGDWLPYAELGTGRTAKRISCGLYHVCVILDNDRLKCWGENLYGQLGYGDNSARGKVRSSLGRFSAFASSSIDICALMPFPSDHVPTFSHTSIHSYHLSFMSTLYFNLTLCRRQPTIRRLWAAQFRLGSGHGRPSYVCRLNGQYIILLWSQ
jgi:hypothetical protein